MPLIEVKGMRPVRMGEMRVATESRPDGSILVRSIEPLAECARTITDRLDRWARETPDRVFLADRGPDGEWRRLSYAATQRKVRSLAQGLIGMELSADRPILILSGNSIEHGLLALAAMYIGVPYAPISPAYSLISKDFAKLEHAMALLTPGLVFVDDRQKYGTALAATLAPDIPLMVARNGNGSRGEIDFKLLSETRVTPSVDAVNALIGPDSIAKFLLTSGSTGLPKAVINTQRMLCFNQEMIRSAWAVFQDYPPVLVDWLPWNHTAGSNHNFGLCLYNGGSLYIDDGNPTEQGIQRTVRNLAEIAPTAYFNVPKGYEMLVAHLETNEKLRSNFFSRVAFMQYAGAGLAPHVWDGLERLAHAATGEKIVMVSGYGSTETAPFAFTTTWVVNQPGEIGLPAAGLEIKLVPNEEKLELRLRGPSVTPGYWRQPEITRDSFDAEGFYKIGDALRFADPNDINRGFIFDGRVSEDFKLDTGTWVNFASVRMGLISAFAPYVRDVVLSGINRSYIGAMLFPDADACRLLCPELPPNAGLDQIAAHPAFRAEFQTRLDTLAARSTGSSTMVARALMVTTPPSLDSSEITDKGSINQRAVIANRPEQIEALYGEPVPPNVFVATRKPKP